MKIRVHELAKRYNMGSKEFLNLLQEKVKVPVSSNLSGLAEEDVKKIENYFNDINKKNNDNKEIAKPDKTTSKGKGDSLNKKIIEEDDIFEEESLGNGKKSQYVKMGKEKKNWKNGKNSSTEDDKQQPSKKNKKKKGRRTDFVMKTVDSVASETIEEDGVKLIKIRGEITLGDFAERLGVSSAEIIKKLFMKGQMLTINSPISIDMAEEIAMDYDALVEQEEEIELEFGEKFALEVEDKAEDLVERPPVITIMGHVDHGKTSLLDAIRASNVVSGEAGGITQKIGAYQIIKDGKKITFVDTPGHEAFTDMRARGAQVTDIAILVVAADDGVMPQTIEALSHAKAANVPIIVAVNKIDKPEANPMKVKQELMEHGLVSIEWGGDTEFVEVSAKKHLNLDTLLDTILITAEIIGFNQVPQAGDTMYVIQNEQHAKRIVEEVAKERKLAETSKKTISLESLSEQFDHENIKELNLVLRADSRGSVEALRESLLKLSTDEVAVNIIQAASGAITESDVKLAEVSNAIIIGFHVRPTTKAIKEAEVNGVEIRTSNIIYHITEDIEKALTGMLEPEFKEAYLGRIEIKKVFKVSKVGNIAGCVVVDGKVKNDSNIRILRDGIVMYEGKLSSLKRYKDDAKEVVAGQECGLGVENFNDIKEGDIVEAFEIQEIQRTLK